MERMEGKEGIYESDGRRKTKSACMKEDNTARWIA
jgi:hypothetical protein